MKDGLLYFLRRWRIDFQPEMDPIVSQSPFGVNKSQDNTFALCADYQSRHKCCLAKLITLMTLASEAWQLVTKSWRSHLRNKGLRKSCLRTKLFGCHLTTSVLAFFCGEAILTLSNSHLYVNVMFSEFDKFHQTKLQPVFPNLNRTSGA